MLDLNNAKIVLDRPYDKDWPRDASEALRKAINEIEWLRKVKGSAHLKMAKEAIDDATKHLATITPFPGTHAETSIEAWEDALPNLADQTEIRDAYSRLRQVLRDI